ncbi:proSAAS [Pleurodeles waltl]
MMGPALLLALLTALASVLSAACKPLGNGPRSPGQEDVGATRRFRRDLQMSLPYEAELMAYPPAEAMRTNEAYYPEMSEAMLARLAGLQQDERLAQALERLGGTGRTEAGMERLAPSGREQEERLALQQMMEEGRRRDKEAVYLANLLRYWNDMNQARGYNDQLAGQSRAPKAENSFPGGYPDYDETALASNMVKAPSSRNQLNAQMAQALLNRYRQEGGFEASPSRMDLEEPNDEDGQMDEEVLRYLVGRILTGMSEAGGPQRLSRRDLGLSNIRPEYRSSSKRVRRSLDEDRPDQANLLRVKRLGEGDEALLADAAALQDATYKLQAGLQRVKRTDEMGDEPTKPARSKRFAGYSDPEYSEQLLKYLPE